jgi:hypothetical protein
VSEPNVLLRQARERLESPSCPGSPLTRLELANAVNTYVHRATGKLTSIDANHIGKWERGEVRWPVARYRAALRAILDVTNDAELGFRRSPRGTPPSVDRKTFLKTTLGLGAGVAVSRHLPGFPDDLNELAAAVSGPTTHYRRMESAVASDQLLLAVTAHLDLATGIVNTHVRNSTGFAVLAEVSGLAAWLAADRCDNATARKRYNEAIAHAEHAHHPLLASYMTASLGHFAIEAGHARPGLTLLDRATSQLDKAAPNTARAWLASLQAVGQASLGDRTATLISLRRAEKLTDRRRGEPHWPWVFSFDTAKMARYQASALTRLGDLKPAHTAFDAALPALTAPKPQAMAQIERAHAFAGMGNIGAGCLLATQALSVGHTYGSERITTRVRDFRASLPTRTSEARDLDDALAALYDQET